MRKLFTLLLCLVGISGVQTIKAADEIYAVCEGRTMTIYYDANRESREGSTDWSIYKRDAKKVVFDASVTQARPTSTAHWFEDFDYLENIEHMDYLNTSNVTDMSWMFNWCYNLTSLDVFHFNTSNVTSMERMFCRCEKVTSLDLSNFNTSKVTNMSCMFAACFALTSLNLSNFNTSSVTNMSEMFTMCYALPILNLSNFNTSKVTNMSKMFSDCRELKSLVLSNFNTSNVTDMSGMFSGCEKLIALDLSNFNTSNVTDMRGMFNACFALTSLKVSNFNTSNVNDMSSMFQNCGELTPLVLSNFNTSNVTDMSDMFSGCTKLTSLDLSKFNTAIVTDMSDMFSGCTKLTSLDLSKFNTAIVTDMSGMFAGCTKLTSLDLSKFNTANVTDMHRMFMGCTKLTSLDLSNFNTSNVNDMSSMFQNCGELNPLILSNFNTSNVTDMSKMFSGCEKLKSLDLNNFNTSNVKDMEAMFANCSMLSVLDLTSFTSESLEWVASIFSGCTNLTTIYCSEDWSGLPTSKPEGWLVYLNNGLFEGCSHLVGGNGTVYDSGNTGLEYARLDQNGQPGYFSSTTFTVTFLDWDGTKLFEETVEKGMDAKGPDKEPYRDGYNFIGWDKPITNIKTNLTVTAQYEQRIFTVTFLDWDGTKLFEETVEKGMDAKGPEEEPYREEYNFIGWDKPITNIKADLTVTAQYEIAKDEVYGVRSDNTLTLYYNKERSKHGGKTDWSKYKESITKVVLHESMRNARPTSLANWFRDFSSLTEIENLDFLNVSEVEKMDFMFYNCSSLTTIECNNDWYKSSTAFASSPYMFGGCTNLVGGNGTVYNPDEVSRSYAHPDFPGNPGYFTSTGETIENEELTSLFTINSEGKQIVFSKGNLQFRASDRTWQFAPNQYAIIGEKNKNIAMNYDGWIDLFGWGTGSNPTLATTNSAAYATFTDWGANSISNGGTYNWRTLSMDEWDYIINQRPADKRGPAVIAGINGFVLLPDEWTLPSGVSFDPSAANEGDNTFTAEEWTKMEENGAVFLPCAGVRSDKETNTTVNQANKVGIYWSSTPETENPDKENYAKSVYIMGKYIIDNINPYSNGLSVRLVREVWGEGIEDVQGDKAQSTKVIRNGVLLIERNDKIYNAQGAEVK